jgi:hypothetical protein
VRSLSASSKCSMTWTFAHSTWWPGTCFLIIDGRKRRLDPMLLTYINDDNHVWKVCLGVPYATSYWQVGIQGMLVPRKMKLFSYKCNRGMLLCINPWDVISVMKRCFGHSYGRVQTNNKNAMSDQDWCPANWKLPTRISSLMHQSTSR